MLTLEKVNQFYAKSHILHDVSLEVPNGSAFCLLGRNGEGKTTTLNVIMGLLKAASGHILLNEEEISFKSPEQRAALGLGYVPQGRQIFPLLTVEENLKTGLKLNASARGRIPDFVYDFFPVLKEMKSRRGGDLSGGQQQQLAIARALVTNPKLLILDEPTEGIQPNIVSEIAQVLKRLNLELNLTILLVEQKVPLARRIGSHFAILERGAVAACGHMHELDDKTVDRYLKV